MLADTFSRGVRDDIAELPGNVLRKETKEGWTLLRRFSCGGKALTCRLEEARQRRDVWAVVRALLVRPTHGRRLLLSFCLILLSAFAPPNQTARGGVGSA